MDPRTPRWAQERIDVSQWPVRHVETTGTNQVVWLKAPDTGQLWLHKSVHVPSNGVAQGEDWAEVVTTQASRVLRVPCAETRLCSRNGVPGSLSRSVVPAGCDLNEGGVVLEAACVPGYIRQTDNNKARDPRRPHVVRPGHNLDNIGRVLQDVHPPPSFDGPVGCTGFDVFAGFLILDALVANRDRHEQNWAVLRPRLTDQPERLAPSYDHGGSLGYNLRDERRGQLLRAPADLEAWAAKGTAHRFEHVPPAPTLVDHAAAAVRLCTPKAAQWWQAQLASLDLSELHGVLATGVSGMSETAATFASRVLDVNLRRLRDAINGGA